MSNLKSVTAVVETGPSRYVVEMLERLLVDARSGRLRGMAVALDYVGHGSRDLVKEAGGDWLTLMAEIEMIKLFIAERIRDEEHMEERES